MKSCSSCCSSASSPQGHRAATLAGSYPGDRSLWPTSRIQLQPNCPSYICLSQCTDKKGREMLKLSRDCTLPESWREQNRQEICNANCCSGKVYLGPSGKPPLPFLSVPTGRDGYSLGSLAGARSWKWWPEASVTGIRACRGGGSTTSGRAGRGAAAGAGLHLALDRPLRRLRSWWSTRRQARHYPVWGRGKVDPSKSCRISFFIISQFLCH